MRLAIVSCAAALALSSPLAAQSSDRVERVELPVSVQLDAMPTGSLVTLLMRDIMKVPFVISSDVLTDRRPISVNLVMARREIPTRVFQFLKGIGLEVELVGGTVYVSRSNFGRQPGTGGALPGQVGAATPGGMQLPGQIGPGVQVVNPSVPASGAPVAGYDPAIGVVAGEVLAPVVAVIEPAHREPIEFVDVLETVLPQLNVAAREGSAPQDQAIASLSAPDRLVISGPQETVERALEIVRAIDVPRPSVVISGAIVELSERQSRGSALTVLADLFNGRLGGSSLGSEPVGPQSISVAFGGIKALLSAVREDGRFSVVAEPQLRVQSGSLASLNAGAEVPTLGAVSFTDSGQAVRSVVYRSSGVTLKVRPVVQGDVVALSVSQERSSFVRTNTGVEDSPTLNQTSVQSEFSLKEGETLLLAGLSEKSESDRNSGLLGGLLGARGSEKSSAQLVLMLQADIVAAAPHRSPSVLLFGADDTAGMVENEEGDV